MLSILILVVMAVVLLLWQLSDPNVTGVVVSAAGFIASLAAQEIREASGSLFRRWDQRWSQRSLFLRSTRLLSSFARTLKRIAPAFAYADFSLILASLLIFGLAALNLVISNIEELETKQFLSFGPKEGGFVYLQLYLVEYIYVPPLLLACASYGFYRGVRDGRLSFGKLMLAILVGFLVDILFVSLLYGGFTGIDNYREVAQVTPESMPSGTQTTSPLVLIGFGVGAGIAYAGLGLVFSFIGRLVRRSQSRRPQLTTT